jgi:hypothetical protein
MHLMRARHVAVAFVAVVAGLAGTGTTRGALFTDFTEAGRPVNGFQDDFTTGTRDPDWRVIGNDAYTLPGDGTLRISTVDGDPNKLLYSPVTAYSATAQNVLALMRVNTSAVNDAFRSGVTAVADPNNVGEGFNLHFREEGQNGAGRHFNLLDDRRAWGPATTDAGNPEQQMWAPNTYYWLRLVHAVDAPAEANNLANGANDVFGKVWVAGTGEPANFDVGWDRGGRDIGGLAGLAGPVANGQTDVSVDYILIQAAGLPAIQAVPEPAVAGWLGLSALGLVARRRRR